MKYVLLYLHRNTIQKANASLAKICGVQMMDSHFSADKTAINQFIE
jgi:hypothetical protein